MDEGAGRALVLLAGIAVVCFGGDALWGTDQTIIPDKSEPTIAQGKDKGKKPFAFAEDEIIQEFPTGEKMRTAWKVRYIGMNPGPGLVITDIIKDNGPARKAHTEWTYSAPVADVERALAADHRTAVARFRDLHVERRDHGRAIEVTVRGETRRSVSAEVLREVLGRAFGPRAIRSAWFDVRTRRGTVTFKGRGYGHGVGLCQAGALARIEHGTRPTDVIQKYFPGTGIRTFR